MKKFVPAIALAFVLLLVVIGYKAQGEHQADMSPEETVKVEETPPAETNEPVNQVEQMSINTQQEVDTRREATLMDLLDLFQTVYDCRADWISLGETEEVLELLELEEVNVQVAINPDVMYPADIQNQYLTWKAIYYGTTEPVSAEQQQNTNTSGNSTTTTTTTPAPTQTETPASTGNSEIPQLVSGDLGIDVTGGKTPMDFWVDPDLDPQVQEVRNSGFFVDMSKVGFGN